MFIARVDQIMADPGKFRVGLIQLAVGAKKTANLERAETLIRASAGQGAKVIALPECFNSPYGVECFPEYAESIPGTTTQMLSRVAKDCGIYLIGGSLPERDGEKLYNTCPVFGPNGNLLGKYSKMHLFDIDIPGKITFQESCVLTAGNDLLTFDTEWCKIGIGICHDMRFPELASLYSQQGCKLLFYPGAFNMTTGPLHWELLTRGIACVNQLYVAAVGPARDEGGGYTAWAHTTLANPWGEVVATTEDKEAIVYSDIDLAEVDKVRANIPVMKQKRNDIYLPAKLLKEDFK